MSNPRQQKANKTRMINAAIRKELYKRKIAAELYGPYKTISYIVRKTGTQPYIAKPILARFVQLGIAHKRERLQQNGHLAWEYIKGSKQFVETPISEIRAKFEDKPQEVEVKPQVDESKPAYLTQVNAHTRIIKLLDNPLRNPDDKPRKNKVSIGSSSILLIEGV